ncbi:helix-turn-helix domain-containing protein [Rhodococcus sp. IEGM1428]|uniref:helix-turn-helix domain-containing protein n=1 Tax=Rhodococcus sp. IEGM1428 TaxID=3392191 RepID=UPI003D0F8EB4
MNDAQSLSNVVGSNLKRLRTESGWTLEAVSVVARRRGLRWSPSRVADMEGGRVAATLPTVIALTVALNDLLHESVTLGDLLISDLPVEVNPSLGVASDKLRSWFFGKPAELPTTKVIGPLRLRLGGSGVAYDLEALSDADGVDPQLVEQIHATFGETEARISDGMDISPIRLAVLSAKLWGRAFASERDARAGAHANPQKRGRITRELKDELNQEIRHHGDSR